MGEQAEQSLRSGGLHGDLPAGVGLRPAGRMSLGAVPAAFSLRRTAMSHGWCSLPPTAYDAATDTLYRTLATPDAGPVTVWVQQRAGDGLTASWSRAGVGAAGRRAVRDQLRHMLAVDDDLADLHDACRAVTGLGWVCETGVGRLLRSPTVFEDLVKTLATTNCSWALTRAMCRRLVDTLGEQGPEDERAFPTPQAMAAAGVGHFTDVVRTGYRSRAFVELAERVASGETDPQRWLDPSVPDEQVLAELLALRGFGPYAAEGMLGLLGRPRGLALDSWVRAKLPRVVGAESLSDAQIRERYAALGRWAGTGLWLELTRDWFEEDGR